MLQQILDDMFVDPDILAELDEEQKQILFCKIREEQVRRWKMREHQFEKESKLFKFKKKKSPGRRVQFLLGTDGEPWTWIMGDYPGDPSIEDILAKEARERAKKQAEIEAQRLRIKTEEELADILSFNKQQIAEIEAVQKAAQQKPVRYVHFGDECKLPPSTKGVLIAERPYEERFSDSSDSGLSSGSESGLNSPPRLSTYRFGWANEDNRRSSLEEFEKAALDFSREKEALELHERELEKSLGGKPAPPKTKDNSNVVLKRERVEVPIFTYFGSERVDDFRDINSSKPSTVVEEENIYDNVGGEIQHELYETLREVRLEVMENRKKGEISQQIAMFEGLSAQLRERTLERMKKKREKEIFRSIQSEHRKSVEESAKSNQEQEQLWKEQERKAKETEKQIREIARKAREAYKRSFSTGSDTQTIPERDTNTGITGSTAVRRHASLRPPKPPTQEAIVSWFRREEVPRGSGLEATTTGMRVCRWFHGLISRQECEDVLQDKPQGTFLVRVSERIWGYTISFKGDGRCKHFLVDASDGQYQFLGGQQITHRSLAELVKYHSNQPITISGQEYLLHPCPNKTGKYDQLYNGII